MEALKQEIPELFKSAKLTKPIDTVEVDQSSPLFLFSFAHLENTTN